MTIEEIRQKTAPVFKRHGVMKAALFGSYARREDSKNSDVDFLVELPEQATLFDLVDLQNSLKSTLGIDVDIGTYRSLKPALRPYVFKDQIQIL